MITITFIAAVITGTVLAVKIWRMSETKAAVKRMLTEKLPQDEAITKDYLLARGVIKF